jgi:pimeloyl-ACP methyl ester carboxylesterase
MPGGLVGDGGDGWDHGCYAFLMRSVHFIRAALLALAMPCAVAAQPPDAPPTVQGAGASTFTIFLRGLPIGTEQTSVSRGAEGWTIVSSGRIGAPLDIVARRIEVRYTPEWKPRRFSLDGTLRGRTYTINTTVEGVTATSTTYSEGQAGNKTAPIDPNALFMLPNSFFGPFEALAAHLRTAIAPGTDIPMFGVPLLSFTIRVGETATEYIQTTARVITARRTRLTLNLPSAPIDAALWLDENGRMIRFSVPTQSLEVAREDIAAVSSRTVTVSRPNDDWTNIPSNGFNLAATISRPVNAAGKLPAVVLVGGSGPTDRDELVFGIPVLGEIANALSDAGFLVVRYDKRGIGQSGGRAEAAGLNDYADDVRAAVDFVAKRKDVDPKRIAVVGHSEGGLVGLIAAGKDKRVAAVALLSTPGISGADLILSQQQHLLNQTKMTPEEKQAKVDAQKQIQEAVISGKGLDKLPAAIRRQVDNAEFQSILTTDPAKLMSEVKQPLLVVQGELDTQVEPANADQLRALADKRKKAPATEVVKVPGINHLLVPAKTGEVDEYARLEDKHVSPAVTQAIATWLKKTLSAAR